MRRSMTTLILATTLLIAGGSSFFQARAAGLKNVHVHEGYDKQQLMGQMKIYARSLGVKCGYCHVKGDFPSDDKANKRAARSMMKMVKSLNRDYFPDPDGVRVTCFTCHQGKKLPLNTPE